MTATRKASSAKSVTSLGADELERYARHIVLPEIGGPGQQKLKAAKVTVIGAGGLGSPVLQYLAAAGLGSLTIIDDDRVSLSNLQRQIIHDTALIGEKKGQSARRRIHAINPHVQVLIVEQRLNAANARALLTGADVVVDGSDSFETRFTVAETCEALEIPLVTGAVGRFDGSLTVLEPWLCDKSGRQNPRYRDVFPDKPPAGLIPGCAEAGLVGALTGVIGTLQAMEVIKLVTGIGDPLVGRLLLYDALSVRFEMIRYARSADTT